MVINIVRLNGHKTVGFACRELARYLRLADPAVTVNVRATDEGLTDRPLYIGESETVKSRLVGVEDAELDDSILIDTEGFTGIIGGANPRAVLIAVYRFLRELGFDWIRPGKDGEIIPEALPADKRVLVSEKPSYRHRIICVEGAAGLEHVRAMLDWIPKKGMNGYFIQFLVPYYFLNRWYAHLQNESLGSYELSVEDVIEMREQIESELYLRSLHFHSVGHGWCCDVLGVAESGWGVPGSSAEVPKERLKYAAMMGGKRQLFRGNEAVNTNICMSNPEARALLIDAVVRYCKEKPLADYVHLWLADGRNNSCECPECARLRPSDHYVTMLNELDERLSAEGIRSKIVFLVYQDLLWAPLKSRIKNPDRFQLMFAPISRSYTTGYADVDLSVRAAQAPFVLNNLERATSPAQGLSYLFDWQDGFKGDGVAFEYHLMWDHHKDHGYYRCAELIHSDVQMLGRIGLNGYISCQLQRAAFPNGLPMEMLANTLWNKNIDFEQEAIRYFKTCYGEGSEGVREYLKSLSTLLTPQYLRYELPITDADTVSRAEEAKALIESFLPKIEQGLCASSGNVQRSWEYLGYHARVSLLFADYLIRLASPDKRGAAQLRDKLHAYCQSIELKTESVFDVCLYRDVMDRQLYGHVFGGLDEDTVTNLQM